MQKQIKNYELRYDLRVARRVFADQDVMPRGARARRRAAAGAWLPGSASPGLRGAWGRGAAFGMNTASSHEFEFESGEF